VTEVAPEKVTPAAGDTVYLTTDKLPNGTLVDGQDIPLHSSRVSQY